MTERIAYLRIRGLECWAVEGLGCGSALAPVFRELADVAPDAKADHEGKLLRFADHGQAEAVRARLAQLGYASELALDVESMDWYTPDELSREEAHVLAGRMVPEFARTHPLPAEVRAPLERRLADTLFARFTDDGSTASLGESAAHLIGIDNSRALAEFVDRWLSRG